MKCEQNFISFIMYAKVLNHAVLAKEISVVHMVY